MSRFFAVITTLKCYGDESADERRERVFAVAVVIGHESEWAPAEMEWLRLTNGQPHHAKDETQYLRDPDPQKHKDRQELYKRLTQVLAKSELIGMSVVLDLQIRQELLPDMLPEAAYYKCFTDVLSYTATIARKSNEDKPDQPFRLEFTFDSRLESDGTAGTLYTMFRTQPEWFSTSIFDTKVSFEGGHDPRLEMGDLLAREAMKEFDRKLTKAQRPPRGAYRALAEAEVDGRKRFIWVEHGRRYCEEWAEQLKSPDAKKLWAQYEPWLIRTGRVQHGRGIDNITNRAMYYTWLLNQEALAKKKNGDGS